MNENLVSRYWRTWRTRKSSPSALLMLLKIALLLLFFSVPPLLTHFFAAERFVNVSVQISIFTILLFLPRSSLKPMLKNSSQSLEIPPAIRAVLVFISILVPPIAAQFLPYNTFVSWAVTAVSFIIVFLAIEPITTKWANEDSFKNKVYIVLLLIVIGFVFKFLFFVFHQI
jgi:hypothetical protein